MKCYSGFIRWCQVDTMTTTALQFLTLLALIGCVNAATDYCIIGAGPAGLQLAYYFQRDRLDYVVFERGARAGTFFEVN